MFLRDRFDNVDLTAGGAKAPNGGPAGWHQADRREVVFNFGALAGSGLPGKGPSAR